MKYVLLFCGTGDDLRRYETMSDEEASATMARVGEWWSEHTPKIRGGQRLARGSTATTVRFGADGNTFVTDGPFIEGNEDIGGYAEIEVEDLDEALRMAKTWPARGVVEVRPVIDMDED